MLRITSTHLGPDDRGRGARIRAAATIDGRRRSLTISYPFDGPDAGGPGTYAIPAARLASRELGRAIDPDQLACVADRPASYVYELDDRAPLDAPAELSTIVESSPVLGTIRGARGVAGQVAYTVDVTYPGEPVSRVTFSGSTYGGPVVMVTPGNPRGTFVTDPSRFGMFGPAWVRAFFGGAA